MAESRKTRTPSGEIELLRPTPPRYISFVVRGYSGSWMWSGYHLWRFHADGGVSVIRVTARGNALYVAREDMRAETSRYRGLDKLLSLEGGRDLHRYFGGPDT